MVLGSFVWPPFILLLKAYGACDCFTLFFEVDMSNKLKVWINGEMIYWDQATVHIMSHSFTRGSAVFEVISFHQTPNGTAVFRLDEHLKRLRRTIELLSMELSHSAQEIEHGVMESIKANNLRNGFIKIICYYGNPPSPSCHNRKSLICLFSQWMRT